MALHDEILREIVAGRVPWRFKTRDLQRFPGNRAGYYRVGNREYSKNAINTIPRNHSVRPTGQTLGITSGNTESLHSFGMGAANTSSSSIVCTTLQASVPRMRSST
jgi:hypothetical protein